MKQCRKFVQLKKTWWGESRERGKTQNIWEEQTAGEGQGEGEREGGDLRGRLELREAEFLCIGEYRIENKDRIKERVG